MDAFLIYLFKVNIALCILFTLYMLVFRNNTLFKSKRIFLLSLCAFSLIYPFVPLPIQNSDSFLQNINYSIEIGSSDIDNANTANLGNEIISKPEFTLSQIILFLYLAVVFILIMRFTIQFLGLLKLFGKGRPTLLLGYKVIILPQKIAPFSFFSWIIIDKETSQESDVLEILIHEQTHVDQKHSIDVIFSEIYTILCWFNPLTWILRKEIRLNLEYLADASVLNSGRDTEKYQFHILKLSYPKAIAQLHTSFNFSPLKKRIKMMNTKKSSKKAYLKYLMFVPVVAALLLANQKKVDAMPTVSAIPSISATSDMKVTPAGNVTPAENPVAKQEIQEPAKTKQSKENKDKNGIYNHVEQMPEYPGGINEFIKFIQLNIIYPQEAVKNEIQGTVRVKFVVKKDGSVGEVAVLRSVSPECDEAVISTIKKAAKWTPAKMKGEPVDVWYNIPVGFMLEGGKTKPAESKDSGPKPKVVVIAYK